VKFGPEPAATVAGALLAHSLALPGRVLKKGRLLTEEDAAAIAATGRAKVIVARLDPDDVPEDRAAEALAQALGGAGLTVQAPFTGRCNLVAEAAGVVTIDRAVIDAINGIDEAITVATVAPYEAVTTRQLVATIKVIPFAVPRAVLDACLAAAARIDLHRFRPQRVGLIQTTLPNTKASVLDATSDVTAGRLAALGATLVAERRTEHTSAAVAAAIAALDEAALDLVLIAGASAVVDRRDVLPAGIEAAGGVIHHFGMPVDPGNLLLLAERAGKPVLGLPGCVRSPKLNGADWVIQRLCAGLPVTRADVMAMGVGGLLKEIPVRGQARDHAAAPRAPMVAGLVLAAGRSRRMGRNKLLIPIDGDAMVTHAVDALLSAQVAEVVVVVGHEADAVRAALGTRAVRVVENPDFASGLSTSLKAGLAALAEDVDAALVCLGDMPRVDSASLDRLIAAFSPADGRAIVVPTFEGQRGNPVLLGRGVWPAIAAVTGDVGARAVIDAHAAQVVEVAISHGGVLLDLDTPAALEALA
jgi:molybdenum cofactor cytidylyltransferase